MLAREKRLNLSKDFRWVASGKKSGNTFLKLFYRYGDNQRAKVGISLSKSNFKKAVERNKVRRLVSGVFENLYILLPDNLNLVVIPTSNINTLSLDQIEQEVRQILIKEGIIKQ